MTTFTDFMRDKDAWDMYIVGAAGTGKTTSLRDSVQWCIDNKVPYVVCAFTHKACGLLRSKLPLGANIQTLHSYLKKRPTLNMEATKVSQLQSNIKAGKADPEPKVMFLDEFSMVGEKDLMDIREAQDPEYLGIQQLKVVWIGDPNQLPPVGDLQTIRPSGKYKVKLTKQWRNDNPLQQPLNQLISYIEDEVRPEPLEEVADYFIRGKDIVEEYKNDVSEDKVLLAYTNKAVQFANSDIMGRDDPIEGDKLFSPTTQQHYTFISWLDNVDYIDRHYTDQLHTGSKFKTLEHLIHSDLCRFAGVIDEEGNQLILATVFGHYTHKVARENLENIAVKSNQAIESKFKGYKASWWAKANFKHKLARSRSKAWRDCISFKDCVVCLDFDHAMTVHKSQGSTYNTVYIDTDDISLSSANGYALYLKLMYVAISRASHKVITN